MLARIPLWGWFLVMLAVTYWVYNPAASLYQVWTHPAVDMALPWKLLMSLVALTLLGLVIFETKRNIGFIGVGILVTLIGLLAWGLYKSAGVTILTAEIMQWLTQPIIALILTIGWQWPKVWRSATGTVTTLSPDVADHHAHHGS